MVSSTTDCEYGREYFIVAFFSFHKYIFLANIALNFLEFLLISLDTDPIQFCWFLSADHGIIRMQFWDLAHWLNGQNLVKLCTNPSKLAKTPLNCLVVCQNRNFFLSSRSKKRNENILLDLPLHLKCYQICYTQRLSCICAIVLCPIYEITFHRSIYFSSIVLVTCGHMAVFRMSFPTNAIGCCVCL